jgi:hypothetical protein
MSVSSVSGSGLSIPLSALSAILAEQNQGATGASSASGAAQSSANPPPAGGGLIGAIFSALAAAGVDASSSSTSSSSTTASAGTNSSSSTTSASSSDIAAAFQTFMQNLMAALQAQSDTSSTGGSRASTRWWLTWAGLPAPRVSRASCRRFPHTFNRPHRSGIWSTRRLESTAPAGESSQDKRWMPAGGAMMRS